MTQEEKELLLKDLCARLPYGVIAKNCKNNFDVPAYLLPDVNGIKQLIVEYDLKPYLRPMSSMTEEERIEWMEITHAQEWLIIGNLDKATDWLNKNMFDYRGLIEKGLALPATEGMYFPQKSDDELKKDVAKKLIDVLIYDNDYVNRMTPLDESRHYGNWIDYLAKSVSFPDGDKEWWDKEDRIDIFAIGDYQEKEDMIKNYPSLRELDTVLNEYYDYLNEEFKI